MTVAADADHTRQILASTQAGAALPFLETDQDEHGNGADLSAATKLQNLALRQCVPTLLIGDRVRVEPQAATIADARIAVGHFSDGAPRRPA